MGLADWAVMVGFILVIWYLHIIADKLDGIASDIGSMANYVSKLEADTKMSHRDRQ